VRFARHLAAVLLTVAVVVALGLVWARSSQGSWLGTPGGGLVQVKIFHPGQLIKVRGQHPVTLIRRESGSGLSLSQVQDVEQTLIIMSLFVTVVVAIDAVARRRRRARRTDRPAKASVP
jgi:hypothetical protein